MNKALMARVPGLGNTTIRDVFDKLKENGCICLPFGGAVRDQFLGGQVVDIDADTPCGVNEVVRICKKYWDSKYCKAPREDAKLKIVHIGDQTEADGEEIDLANWNKTFIYELTNLEYTTNSLGYYEDDINNRGVVIDLPGSGVVDTCNKKIRIPVPPDQWENWYNGDSWKIFRYWKLRAKGYTAPDDALPSFIKNKTKEILKIKDGIKTFKKSFCKYAFSGEYKKCDGRENCIVPHPACTDSVQLKEKRNKYYALLEEVLDEYWKDEAKALLDNIHIECASSKGPADCNTENKTSQSLVLIFVGMVIQYCSSFYI
ncbi:Hypothetical predicted protein [Paramuricea clavata]|uniref:Uncharacterized protein n=1 Tax=Paramuricea clavata TaxID=317549 RepID=A0A6S7G3K5_PARCT|nr:Hypothetical predicted protein [Paramuricea clavata]